MRLALDTNRFTDLARGLPDIVAVVEQADEVFLPFVVVAELKHGYRRGTRYQENEDRLRRFLAKPNCATLYPDAQTLEIYSHIQADLSHRGTRIPTNDVWIAAIALEFDLTLATRDAHFKHVPQLKTI